MPATVVIERAVHAVLTRLDEVFPRASVSASREVAIRRARGWAWPSVQIGLSAGLAYLVASIILPDSHAYAPIVAVGAIGLGREQRLVRSALLVAGMFLGAIAAELATPIVGAGWWQIAAMIALTALISGTLVDRDLAVTYAVINAIVLITLPGSEGWLPARLLSGAVGAGVAVLVLLLIVPPRPVHLVRRRLQRASELSGEALACTAEILRHPPHEGLDGGDERPLITAARRLDDEIERSHEVAAQALEIVRWSPLRRHHRAEIERLVSIAHELRPTLRTASTIARIGDRAALVRVAASTAVVDGLDEAAEALRSLVAALLDGEAPPGDDDERAAAVVTQVLSEPPEHALLIALQEETRGLLADVAAILNREFDGSTPAAQATAVGTIQGGIQYGMVDDPA